MSDFDALMRRRRMCRSFQSRPLAPTDVHEIVDLACRAPSAGRSQGVRLILLEGDDRTAFWDLTLPADRRAAFRWPRLLNAPSLLVVFADPIAYVERYAEDDKRRSGLGVSPDDWPAPFWTIDAGMAVMAMLLAAEDRGLGALFFALRNGESAVRRHFDVDDRWQTIGVLALGYPDQTDPDVFGAGVSARRTRRGPSEIMRRGRG